MDRANREKETDERIEEFHVSNNNVKIKTPRSDGERRRWEELGERVTSKAACCLQWFVLPCKHITVLCFSGLKLTHASLAGTLCRFSPSQVFFAFLLFTFFQDVARLDIGIYSLYLLEVNISHSWCHEIKGFFLYECSCKIILSHIWKKNLKPLKCFLHILCGRSAENFTFWLFCIDLVAKSQEQDILKQHCRLQRLVYFGRSVNCMNDYQIQQQNQQNNEWNKAAPILLLLF